MNTKPAENEFVKDDSEKEKEEEKERYRQEVREKIQREQETQVSQASSTRYPEVKIGDQRIVRVEGNNRAELNFYLNNGWVVRSQTTISQGWSGGKTCCLGVVFLPLALLGRKPEVIEYVLEKTR